MATKQIQLTIPGFPNVIRVKYEQTKGASGTAHVYQLEGQNENRITLHADGKLNKHGIFQKLTDEQAMKIVQGYEN